MHFQHTPACLALPASSWFVGLDLGQMQDPTAVAVLERKARPPAPPVLNIQFLKRWELGTPYPQIIADVAALLNRTEHKNASARPLRGSALGLDATGVGRAIVDLFKAARPPCRLYPVTITAGNAATADSGEWHIPKKDLVAVVNAALQTKRLLWDPRLPYDAVLTKELRDFQTRITPAGNEQFGAWREGQHDDLLLAVAIATWLAERTGPEVTTRPFALGGMANVMPGALGGGSGFRF
jgi:hypothetical protein